MGRPGRCGSGALALSMSIPLALDGMASAVDRHGLWVPCPMVSPDRRLEYRWSIIPRPGRDLVRIGSMSVQSFRQLHRLSVALLVAAALLVVVTAQTRQPFSRVAVVVTPDHSNWTYQPGEAATFRIDVLRDGHQAVGATVRYGIGPELLR